MKTALTAFLILLLFSPFCFAQNEDIIISEIMYDPLPSDTFNEWIEIHNNGTGDISLENWSLCDKKILAGYIDRNETLHKNISMTLPPGGYALITDGDSGTEAYDNFAVNESALAMHVDAASICASLTNTAGKPIELKDSAGNVVENITYDPSIGASGNGRSLERNTTGWFESLADGGTPGGENSINILIAPEQNESEPEEPDVQENETIVDEPDENETLPEETTEEIVIETPLGPAKITILSAPASMHFGDYASLHVSIFSGDSAFSEARTVAYIFSPHWISRDLSRDEETIKSAPYSTGVAAAIRNIGTNTTTTAILPLFLKCNEDGKYAEGNYILRVRLYKNEGSWSSVTETDTTLSVSGKNPLCEKEIVYVNITTECETKETAPEIKDDEELELSFDVPEVVYIDENFTSNITLQNHGSSALLVEAQSYLYDRAKLLSYGFDGESWGKTWGANAIQIELAQNESKNISLANLVKNTTSLETHTYKIIIKDVGASKNLKEEIILVRVEKRPEVNTTADVEAVENLVNETVEDVEEIPKTLSPHAIAAEPKQSIIKRFLGWLENIF